MEIKVLNFKNKTNGTVFGQPTLLDGYDRVIGPWTSWEDRLFSGKAVSHGEGIQR